MEGYVPKEELARAYYPNCESAAACRNLAHEFKINKRLTERLAETYYSKSAKQFSPKQVQIIFEELGSPNCYKKLLFDEYIKETKGGK